MEKIDIWLFLYDNQQIKYSNKGTLEKEENYQKEKMSTRKIKSNYTMNIIQR
jgi:hypothetical protein